MKTYNFIVVFKRPNYTIIDRISQFMLLLAVILLAESLVLMPFQTRSVLFLLQIVFILALGVMNHLKQRKGEIPFYRLGFLAASWGLFLQPTHQWIVILFVFAALFEKQVKFPKEIAFDEEEVVLNSFPKKRYQWNEFSNIMLKDGILTADFKNNKLIQSETETLPSLTLQNEFNEFCRIRLQAAQSTQKD